MLLKSKVRSTLTKIDLVEQVYFKLGFSKQESQELVEMVFDILKNHIKSGKTVKVSGFGSFNVRKKKERMGRNPQTGRRMKISARRVLTFKPSPVLKTAVNKRSKS